MGEVGARQRTETMKLGLRVSQPAKKFLLGIMTGLLEL